MDQAMHSSANPGMPLPAWNSAIARHRAGDAAGAIALYQRHLKRHPQDAPGWMNLGAALRRTGCADAALVCYQRAQRLRPFDAAVWSNLGNLWKELGQHEQSLRCHDRALQLAPEQAQLRLNCALSMREAGRFAESEALIEQCLLVDPGRPDLLHQRALLRLHTGRYGEAWPDYEARLQLGARVPAPAAPRWSGERVGGKRMLLHADGDLADTLWAARFMALLARRGADIRLRCPAVLHPVLAGLPLRLEPPRDTTDAREEHDFHCPLMSLPGAVDPRGLTIPEPVAITVPEASRVAMRRRIAPYAASFRIGVAWSGSGPETDEARGAIPLARLLPLAALPGVQLFSLQTGAAATEQHEAGAAGFVVDLGTQCRHLGDTAAALEQMDLVVCCDGAVAHLAAAMDKPVLGLLQFRPHWVYGMQGDATPWYPTMRLLRQGAPGDWTGVCSELIRLVGTWAEIRANRLSL